MMLHATCVRLVRGLCEACARLVRGLCETCARLVRGVCEASARLVQYLCETCVPRPHMDMMLHPLELSLGRLLRIVRLESRMAFMPQATGWCGVARLLLKCTVL